MKAIQQFDARGNALRFEVRALAPGEYLVNERYYVRRTREGAIHTGEIAWYWRDGNGIGIGGNYVGTKTEALAALRSYLAENIAPPRVCRYCGAACPEGYATTCGNSDCQEASYLESRKAAR